MHASANLTPIDRIQYAFGVIRHARLLPKRHVFSYPGYFLRVPIHALAKQNSGNFLFGVNRRALISFNEQDHGDGTQTLHNWITQLLAKDQIYANGAIWLHTFSRVLGYQFKPVSFWFCHEKSGALLAIVAEVNNTFGERHLYLLRDTQRPLLWGALLHATKNFYVSPFFKVEGRYEFRFLNRDDRSVARIDYYINDDLALQTSLSGQYQDISRASNFRAIFGYPVFSAGVVAKIHWQAAKLWLQKRVPFISKPTPPTKPITYGEP